MTSFAVMQLRRRKLINDLILFSAGSRRAPKLDPHLVERVIVTTECLVDPGGDGITETTFISQMMQHFNLTSNFLVSQMFKVLKPQRLAHRSMTVEQYSQLICIFLTTDLDVKIDFVFRVYDIDCDGVLSKSEIYSMLKPTIPASQDEHDDMLKDLIELVMKVLDIDGNGSVDLDEFRALVNKDVLYMEILGQCLPEAVMVTRFAHMLVDTPYEKLMTLFRSEYTLAMLGKLIPPKVPSYYPFPLEY